jgi:hypothetical protein
MKGILKFKLPKETKEFDLANNAAKMYNVLCELDKWLRSNTKYAPDNMSKDTYNAFQQCREQLRELMGQENINFDL